jgi:hypothetical protein
VSVSWKTPLSKFDPASDMVTSQLMTSHRQKNLNKK